MNRSSKSLYQVIELIPAAFSPFQGFSPLLAVCRIIFLKGKKDKSEAAYL
jgi:hypothetical protein